MSTRKRWSIAIGAVIGVMLLICVAVTVFAVVGVVLSGGLDIPYPDGPPPTPTIGP